MSEIGKNKERTIEIDLEDKSAVKRLLDKIKHELFPVQDVKSIVLLKTSRTSKNCEMHYNYVNRTEFRIPDSNEVYALTDSIYEVDGIPVYMVQKDRHANIIMEFTEISEIDEAEQPKYKLKERLLTASELYHIEDSTITKRIFPTAKLDFKMNMFILTLIILAIVGTSFFWYIIYNKPT